MSVGVKLRVRLFFLLLQNTGKGGLTVTEVALPKEEALFFLTTFLVRSTKAAATCLVSFAS
jgi:hypothetical protein